jgi:hypothetical protein
MRSGRMNRYNKSSPLVYGNPKTDEAEKHAAPKVAQKDQMPSTKINQDS